MRATNPVQSEVPLEDTAPWIETDDPQIDGAVSVCPVRDDSGRDGVRIKLLEGEPDAFEAFYDALPSSPVFRVLHREPGAIVFADAPDHTPKPRRFGIEAIDALERVGPLLRGLDPSEIRVASTGGLQLIPRYRSAATANIYQGLARFLEAQHPSDDDPRLPRAISALLDPAPEIQRTARSILVGARLPNRSKVHGGVKLTVVPDHEPPGARADRAPPRAAVVIRPEDLRDLGPADRSAAAGIAGVPLSVLDGLLAADLPLVLETHRRSRTAHQAAARIRKETGLPTHTAAGGSMVSAAWTLSLLSISFATAFAAFTLSLVGLWLIPAGGMLLSLALLALSGRTAWSWWSQRALLIDARDADRESEEERQRRVANPALARVWSTLGDARTALGRANLPAAPASDLRGVLKAAEAEFEALVKAHEAVRAPGSTSSDELRSRVDELDGEDPATQARRSRLQVALADAEALESRREDIVEAAKSIEAVLAEVVTALAHWEIEPGDERALASLSAAARRAKRAE